MSRLTFSSFILSLAFLAVPLFAAQPCNLALSMSCASGSCTSTTINNGTNTCSGTFLAALISQSTGVTISAFTTSLGLATCLDSSTFPAASTSAFGLCLGDAALAPGASFTATANVSGAGTSLASLPLIAETIIIDGQVNGSLTAGPGPSGT